MATETSTPQRTSNADTHITVLAVLNFLTAGIAAFSGIAAWFWISWAGAQGSYWSGLGWIGSAMAEIGAFVALTMFFIAIPALLAGIGLSGRKEWGRTLTLVVAGLVGIGAVISFTWIPLLYSVYAFWALTQDDVAARFRPA